MVISISDDFDEDMASHGKVWIDKGAMNDKDITERKLDGLVFAESFMSLCLQR